MDFGNAKLAGDGIGHESGVASKQDRPHAHAAECVDGLLCFWPHSIGDHNRA